MRRVIPASPAASARMLAGDKLLTVDSKTVSSANFPGLAKYLRGKVGSVVAVTFQRAEKVYGCRLVRADIDGPYYLPGIEPQPIARDKMAKTEDDSGAHRNVSSSPIDKAMISIYRGTNDTAEVKESLLHGLSYMSGTLKQHLIQDGLKIVLTPTIPEALPSVTEDTGHGYDCFGVYHQRTVYVAERWSRGHGVPQKNPSVVLTLLHEIGHAFDDFTGSTSSEDFLKAYKTDCQHISNSDRARYQFFATGEGSTAELFAELFAIAELPRIEIVAGSSELDARDLEKIFPRCFDYVKKEISVF